MMTLAQWCEQTGISPTKVGDATCVIPNWWNPSHKELFHLADYVVSTVSGIVIWLVPRKSA